MPRALAEGILVTSARGGVGKQIWNGLNEQRKELRAYSMVGIDQRFCSDAGSEAQFKCPPAISEEFDDFLLDFVRCQNIKFLIPGSEPDLKRIAPLEHKLAAMGCTYIGSNSALVETCLDKLSFSEFLHENGGVGPATSVFDADNVSQIRSFPVIVKPRTDSSGSRNIYWAKDRNHATALADYLQGISVSGWVAQEYLDESESEFTVSLLLAPDGKLLSSTILYRDLVGLSLQADFSNFEGGSNSERLVISSGISQGTMFTGGAVCEELVAIALRMGFVGPVNFQGRLTNRGPEVFECNPRFSGTTEFRMMAGLNEPALVINYLLAGEAPTWNFSQRGINCRREIVASIELL